MGQNATFQTANKWYNVGMKSSDSGESIRDKGVDVSLPFLMTCLGGIRIFF